MNKTNFFICRSDSIAEVQCNFSRFYPSLEINFFSNVENSVSINSCVLFSPEVMIQDISPGCQDGCIELNDKMTIDDLEHSIHEHFSLHAEISSRIGRRPITTPLISTSYHLAVKSRSRYRSFLF